MLKFHVERLAFQVTPFLRENAPADLSVIAR